jgi:hypothetical protein
VQRETLNGNSMRAPHEPRDGRSATKEFT